MIQHELIDKDSILIVRPEEALEKEDFKALCEIVDPLIESQGGLRGLMIYTPSFPGWNNFGALLEHLQFVREHHKKIQRVAVVTDSGFLKIMPTVADHFTAAEIKHFSYDEKSQALAWLNESV